MQYQHNNTSHNRTGLSTLAEIAGGMGFGRRNHNS